MAVVNKVLLFSGNEFAFRLRANRQPDVEERIGMALPRRRYVNLEAEFEVRKGKLRKIITRRRLRVDLGMLWESYHDMARSYLDSKDSEVVILATKLVASVRQSGKRKGLVRKSGRAKRGKQIRKKKLARGRKGGKRGATRRRNR